MNTNHIHKIYKTCNWNKTHHGHDVLQTNAWFVHRFIVRMRQLTYLQYGIWAPSNPNPPKSEREFTGIFWREKKGHHPTWNGLRRISKGRLPQWKKLWDAPINAGFRPCHTIPSDGENVKHSGAWRMVRHRVITRWIPVYRAQSLLANRFLTSWKIPETSDSKKQHMFGWTAWQK